MTIWHYEHCDTLHSGYCSCRATDEYLKAQQKLIDQLREALEAIIKPVECGCKPCYGSCRIGAAEHYRDIAQEALALTVENILNEAL